MLHSLSSAMGDTWACEILQAALYSLLQLAILLPVAGVCIGLRRLPAPLPQLAAHGEALRRMAGVKGRQIQQHRQSCWQTPELTECCSMQPAHCQARL